MARRRTSLIREDLLLRRSMLDNAIASSPEAPQLKHLLSEVDAALQRMDEGTYGLCETCGDPIEQDRLIADPLLRFCIDHLTPDQQQALEDDLGLASRIQQGLLPQERVRLAGWEASYHYEAAGLVSGDYCDLLTVGENLYFVVGDVSGKGISAAMLMAHLNATFRALVTLELPLERVMEQASRMFCESTLPTHFATLACGKAMSSGQIELSIAGHHPVLVIKDSGVKRIEATGLPLGMFCDEQFSTSKMELAPGDSVFLYTDGLCEAVDASEQEYGVDRLAGLLEAQSALGPQEIISACLADLDSFRSGSSTDDLTIMIIRRLEPVSHGEN